MKLKKLIYAVSAILTAAFLSVSADYIDIENESLGMRVDILEQLGIMSGLEDATFRPDEVMTRGEFAMCAAKLFALTPEESNDFADVTTENEYAGYINALKKAGYISGNGGLFRPDDEISGSEAAVIIMNGLGYGDACAMMGGYPTGYLKMASRADISLGSAPLTRERAARALYDTLTAEILEFSGLVGNEAKFSSNGTLMIDEFYDMVLIEGIMSYNGYASTDGEYREKLDFIVVDGVKINLDGKDASEYLGYEVTVFAYYDESQYYLRAVSPTSGENEVITVSSEDIKLISDERVMHTEKNDVNKKYSLSGCVLIYNGEYLASYEKDILKPQEGYVRIIDNDGDSKYDVVFVYSLCDDLIKGINLDEEYIYFEESDAICYENKEILVYVDGVKKSPKELLVGMTASTAVSDGIITIWASGKKVSGALISSDEEYINIADESFYRSSDLYIEGGELTTGRGYTAYISWFGKVVRLSLEAGGEHYGYLMGILWEDDFEAPSNIRVKLLSDTGAIAYLDVKDKIRINGESGKAELERFSGFGFLDTDRKYVGQFLKYNVNEEGRLLSVTQAMDKTDEGIFEEGFSLDKSVRGTLTRIYRYNVGINYHLGASTKIFYLPLDSEMADASEKDYSVISLNAFPNDVDYNNFDIYDTRADRTIGLMAVRKSIKPPTLAGRMTESEQKRNIGIVLKNTLTYDGDDDVVTLKMFTGGKEVELKASEWDLPNSTQDNWNYARMTAKELKKGDIFLIGKNERDEINAYTILFKGSELEGMNFGEKVPQGINIDTATNDVDLTPVHTVFGEVVDINGTTYSINVTQKRKATVPENEKRHIVTTSAARVYIMDYGDGEYRIGDVGEIKEGDVVFVRLYNYVPNDIVVFKGV